MRYTVVWQPAAQDELAEVWLQSADRDAITQATHRIDQALKENPRQKGEEFYGDRLLVEEPLAVTYAVDDGNRVVRIFQVWSR